MHIKKTLTLKRYKKVRKNLNYRKESKIYLFNEKLELIKISKYTHTHTHEKKKTERTAAALCVDSRRGEAVAQDHPMACRLKEKNAKRKTKQNETQYLSTIQSIYNKHKIQNYFTMLPFLIQKMPILGVYIYIYTFSVVYC